MRTPLFSAILLMLALNTSAQPILFDFDAAPAHSPLPISLTIGGVTAQFSATGQGYSIQAANALGFTPVGFSGNCIYPSSVFAADLQIGFSTYLSAFSILYAPEEYACDSSATMRVTAFSNNVEVATATMNAAAGTWPSEILQVAVIEGFNSVVVHYDQAPVTGGDYGPIFMADNMQITPLALPIVLGSPVLLPNGVFQFSFANLFNRSFTVFRAVDVTAPPNWIAAGPAVEISPGEYRFTDFLVFQSPSRFYQVRLN
jgi:hypothetical protein